MSARYQIQRMATDSRLAEQHRPRIEARRAQADLLLSTANHESVKAQIRLGLRDLDEALLWLKRHDSVSPEFVEGMVRGLLTVSGCRLDGIRALLRTSGPGATLTG